MRPVVLATLLATGACAGFLRGGGGTPDEMLYRRALHYLDTDSPNASVDSAVILLDRYLSSPAKKERAREAIVLRRLAVDARELARVEAALLAVLQAQSAETTETKTAETRPDEPKPAEPAPRRREPESRPSERSVREIQRLRDELREANAELERIRKRLAAPKP